MKIRYGLATYDRHHNTMMEGFSGLEMEALLEMDDVDHGSLGEFLQSAGDKGWELCGCFPSATVGFEKVHPKTLRTHTTEESAEDITFIFKKLEK